MSFTRTLVEEAIENRRTWIAELRQDSEQKRAEIENNMRFDSQFTEELRDLNEKLNVLE